MIMCITMICSSRIPGRSQDEELEDVIRQSFLTTGYSVLGQLTVQARSGVVTLGGSVPTYHLRQIAHRAVLRLPGVTRLLDEIVVIPTRRSIGIAGVA
jgi:osmotically-inducible protein OsmY